MKDTLEMMKNIVKGQPRKSTEELITDYQKNKNGVILAYMYISNYGLITRVAEKWPKLDDADKASFCLQELDKALRNYKNTNKAKFATYFYKCFDNRLRTETEALMTDKRKTNLYINSSECKDELLSNYYFEDNYFEDEQELLNSYNLTTNEKTYCNLLMKGYKPREIACLINKTVQGIYYLNGSVRKKILSSL